MTITEIAARAGVSIGTVDRVIHNRGHVADSTRKAVQAIIDEYHYTPNQFARQLKRNTPFTIGVLLPPLDTGYGYWHILYTGMQEAVESLNPFNIQLAYKPFDRTKPGSLYQAGKDLLNQHSVDALILAPVAPDDAARLLVEVSIPYIFIDSPLPSASPLSVIAQNPFKGGQTAGHIMKLLRGNGTFTVIRMYATAYNLRERSRGFQSYFENNTNCRVIDSICPYETTDGVFEFMDELFCLHPDINGIFVTHTEAFMFGQYLSYTGKKEQVALIGYDLQTENQQGLVQGNIDCIISQRPEYQGHTSVYEIYRSMLLSQSRADKIHIPIDILFAESAPEYNMSRL